MSAPSTYPVRVFVRDLRGTPIPGAVVEVVCYSPCQTALSTTAADGTATLDIPADAAVLNVLALLPGLGLDYFENYHSWPPGRRELAPLPPQVHLVLDGAREVSVQAVDSGGRPVPDIPLTPWTVKKRGKLSYVNCSGSRATAVRTDTDGLARFAWIPTRLEGVTHFPVQDRAYYCPNTAWLDPAHPDQLLTARLLRNTRVGGRVLFPAGGPAREVAVQAEGRGRTGVCRMKTKSNPDGTYELLLYPDQSYILAVLDDVWAARSLHGVVTREGHPQTDLDLHLLRGTRLRGRITLGPDRQPASGQRFTVWERGGELGKDLRLHYQHEELVRWAVTDEAGRYELRVGPGRYRVSGPEPIPEEELVVEAEEEVIRDFHLPYLPRALLTGQVHRAGEARKVVGHAVVRGETNVASHAGFEAVTDGQGRFSTERWRERMIVYARDPEGAEAGCTEIGEQDEEVRVEVSPAATARGRVVDRGGGLLSSERVFCLMKTALRDGTTVRAFRMETQTDLMGEFTIPGLLLGSSCSIEVLRGCEPTTDRFQFGVQEAGVLELPDLVVQEPGT